MKANDGEASAKITRRIEELADWRGLRLARMRELIHAADPAIVEEWKWMGTPCFSHDGIVCTGESYKQVVKLTFARGASLKDPKKLFNSSLEGNMRRAIDIREDEKIDEAAFKALVREAVTFNSGLVSARAAKKPGASNGTAKKVSAKKSATKATAKNSAKKAAAKPRR